MKKNVKKTAPRKLRGFHLVVIALLLLIGAIGYYRAKIHEQFGLKRFTSFTHPFCMEPLMNVPVALETRFPGQSWDVFADPELGVELQIPVDWKVTYDCPTHMCTSSQDFDGTHGQIVRIARIDSRIGFPYEHFYFARQPTNILSYLLGQKDCAYVKVGNLYGIRQFDRTSYRRTIYALDAGVSTYILTTENFDNDEKADKTLEAVVSNFVAIPIEPKIVGDLGPYRGIPSPRVVYKTLEFKDVDIYSSRQIDGKLVSENRKSDGGLRGYTFAAYKGDKIEFTLIVPGSINVLSDASLELYSYGPTVLRGEGRLEWRVPVTGRYFLVVKDASNKIQDRTYWLRTQVRPY